MKVLNNYIEKNKYENSNNRNPTGIIPYIIKGNSIIFILFRSNKKKNPERYNKLEVLGGNYDKEDKDDIDCAIRETYEESARYLKFTRNDLEYALRLKYNNIIYFLIQIDNATNIEYQKYRKVELNKKNPDIHYLEMNKLVKFNTNQLNNSKNKFIKSIYGKEYELNSFFYEPLILAKNKINKFIN
jgi:hypothetical protein